MTSRQKRVWLLLFMLSLIWLGWSGCKTSTVIIPSASVVHFVSAGQSVTATNDSDLLSLDLYRRYLRAVNDQLHQ